MLFARPLPPVGLRPDAARGQGFRRCPSAPSDPTDSIVCVDAIGAYSLLSFDTGLPLLVEKARAHGLAAMSINNCCHVSALWPEVEDLAS